MLLTAENVDAVDFAKYPDGLAPAIVQDPRDGRVLMLGYCSAESLRETFASGRVTFFSRSKGRLWTKGETSGNHLDFRAAYADCDRDALLLHAVPLGPTCHTGADTCFGQPDPRTGDFSPAQRKTPTTEDATLTFLADLERLLHERQPDPDSDSYTSRLLAKGTMKVAQKVGEEGVELALEAVGGTDELLLEEAADLMYHYLLLLRAKGKRLSEVVEVLRKRHTPT